MLVVQPDGNKYVKTITIAYTFKVTNGLRYLVGFIGENLMQTDWIQYNVKKQMEGVSYLATLAKTHP